jgi:hypothetical protein
MNAKMSLRKMTVDINTYISVMMRKWNASNIILRFYKDPWALACVDSRANFLGERYSMTPILDMVRNHRM